MSPDNRLVVDSESPRRLTVSTYSYTGEPPSPDTVSEDAERWNLTESVTYDNGSGRFQVTEIAVEGHVVVSLDDTVVWQRPMSASDHVELRVYRNGTVELLEDVAV